LQNALAAFCYLPHSKAPLGCRLGLFQCHPVKVIVIVVARHARQALVGGEEDCLVQESHKDILLSGGRGHPESKQAAAGILKFVRVGFVEIRSIGNCIQGALGHDVAMLSVMRTCTPPSRVLTCFVSAWRLPCSARGQRWERSGKSFAITFPIPQKSTPRSTSMAGAHWLTPGP
jgi:hypothetical protein